MDSLWTRRHFMQRAIMAGAGYAAAQTAAKAEKPPQFATRGVVIVPEDVQTWPWPERAQKAGLTTLALHSSPAKSAAFVQSDAGQTFLSACRRCGLSVEYEAHSMVDLLPNTLFDKAPEMFRMDQNGQRVREYNFCVHAQAALDTIVENAVRYAKINRPDTHRYFFWIDDGQPMCRCPQCRELTDSEQTLLFENQLLKTLRRIDPEATLSHLCYHNTLQPPKQIKPDPGIFLEFAPIQRAVDRAIPDTSAPGHAAAIEALDANLAVFGAENAQALEYWLDVSRFSDWKREKLRAIPWYPEVLRRDLAFYATRGIRHITSFAVWANGDSAAQFGDPPLEDYGAALGAPNG